NWTLKKLKQWVFRTFGRVAGRNTLRRLLREAKLTWKKVKKLLGKANPQKRAAHVKELLALFAGVREGEILLLYVDEVHVHRDLDLGYTWGRRGERLWRKSDCPKLQERMNAYGAYDFSNGECFLWHNGWCNGEQTVNFLRAPEGRRGGQKGGGGPVWGNASRSCPQNRTAGAAPPGAHPPP